MLTQAKRIITLLRWPHCSGSSSSWASAHPWAGQSRPYRASNVRRKTRHTVVGANARRTNGMRRSRSTSAFARCGGKCGATCKEICGPSLPLGGPVCVDAGAGMSIRWTGTSGGGRRGSIEAVPQYETTNSPRTHSVRPIHARGCWRKFACTSATV